MRRKRQKRAHPVRLGPVSDAYLDRAVSRLRRSLLPPDERGWYYLSFARRTGLVPRSAHLSALDMRPRTAVEVAEAAGIRMTLTDLAGYNRCPAGTPCRRRWDLIDSAGFFLKHCGGTTPDEVFDVFGKLASAFFKAAGLRISLHDFNRRVDVHELTNYAHLVSDLTVEALATVTSLRAPDNAADILHRSGLGVSIQSIAYVCHRNLTPSETAKYVIKYSLAVDLYEAARAGWSPMDLWTVVRRDAALPGTAEFFAAPFAWTPVARAIWFLYRRSVRVIQQLIRTRIRRSAALKIQAFWKRIASDPYTAPGRRRLERLFIQDARA